MLRVQNLISKVRVVFLDVTNQIEKTIIGFEIKNTIICDVLKDRKQQRSYK